MGIDRGALLGAELDDVSRARRAFALDLAEAALEAVEPARATHRALDRLRGRGDAPRLERVGLEGATLFAFGKAAIPMARAALQTASIAGGLVIALEPVALPPLEVRRGGHPVPAADAIATGERALAIAERLGAGDVALCLVSGGGSAMLELPGEGVTLDDIARLTRLAMERGADIAQLNAVRRALSRLKGGGLAAAIAPASIVNVILSDVPGHPLHVVASGPTLPPPAHPRAQDVLRALGLEGELPRAVRDSLDRAPALGWPRIVTELAADNGVARDAVVGAARPGVHLSAREGTFAGEARALGARIAAEPDRDWVWGGETTVTLRGAGRGGRNQEVALAALVAGFEHGLLLTLATDGVDGASANAGAIVDAAALAAARARGLDPAAFLADNDSASFFDAIGAAIRTGPTSTNVADICIALS